LEIMNNLACLNIKVDYNFVLLIRIVFCCARDFFLGIVVICFTTMFSLGKQSKRWGSKPCAIASVDS